MGYAEANGEIVEPVLSHPVSIGIRDCATPFETGWCKPAGPDMSIRRHHLVLGNQSLLVRQVVAAIAQKRQQRRFCGEGATQGVRQDAPVSRPVRHEGTAMNTGHRVPGAPAGKLGEWWSVRFDAGRSAREVRENGE